MAHLRPAHALAGDVAAVLREGAVLAGEVLETLAGDTLLLAIGRHKVPAQTQVKLEPGQGFLFRVEREGGEILLRILGDPAAEAGGLLRALRNVVAHDRPLGELLRDLASSLRAEARENAALRPRLEALLGRLDAHLLKPGAGAPEILRHLARSGLGYEAALLRAALGDRAALAPEQIEGDLKLELLRALASFSGEGEEGAVHEALRRALAGLEAEQLLNLARKEAHEPLHWSLALADGGTAHLLVRREQERRRDADGSSVENPLLRVTLGVELSRTGPVRVDLWLRAGSLAGRVLVEREELAVRARARLAELAQRLATEGRSVRLTAGVGSREDLAVEDRMLDIAYLRDHRLMDVEG